MEDKDIRRFKFVIPDNKKTNYSWNPDDPSVPTGWLTTLITMNSFGKLVRSKRFMAPDGRFCSSRDESVKYIVKEGLYEDEEITMREAGYEYDNTEAEYVKAEEVEEGGSAVEAATPKRKFAESPYTLEITKKIKTEDGVEIKKEVPSDDEDEVYEHDGSFLQTQFKIA